MYLTIHCLDRVPPADPGLGDWADDVSAVLDRAGERASEGAGDPVARWVGVQAGSSRGTLISLWDAEQQATSAARTEGSTPTRITLSPTSAMRVLNIDLGPDGDQLPAVVQLAVFDGPRGAVQTAADRIADQRIALAVQEVPGYCGALVALAADGGYAVVVLARSAQALAEGRSRLTGAPLRPDEDPALLTGPDRTEQHDLVRTGRPLSALVAGGVR